MKKISAYIGVFILIISSSVAYAAVRLPAIFGDNMVLQRNVKVPIWGWAEIGEKVEIGFMGKTYSAVTGSDGKWSLKLGSYKAGGPYEMTIGSKTLTLTLKNILIGDVWVASGQSNMEFGIQNEQHGADAIAKATDAQIHLFYVPMAKSLHPESDIATVSPNSLNGKWIVCSPEAMGARWASRGFSAIGYYFAQQLRQSTGVPVGMIGTYVGGTPAQAWISEDGLKQSPAFSQYVDTRQKLVDKFAEANSVYPPILAAYKDSLRVWNKEVGNDYAVTMKQWDAAVAQAKANGQPLPPRPRPSRPGPRQPADPDGGWSSPANLFNGMVEPVLHYGIKGVIWYQGEGNGDRLVDAAECKTLFPRLIQDWRTQWQQGTFPFLFVQLPNFRDPAKTPAEGIWPWIREAQKGALSLPLTGMAVITDVGNDANIHPTNKYDPALRLSLVARHVAYNEKLIYSGPEYKSIKIDGNKVVISFDEVNKGLVIGRPGVNGDNQELKGFGIAGSDQKFVWAKAVIEGNTIVVTSDQVTNPIAIRYNWADNPPGNLYNKDGLPAGPFRTDDWPIPLRVLH